MADEKKKEADFHAPGGVFFDGDTLGHGNAEGRIRKRDGVFFRGEEIGSVDENDQIRRKDGIFFRGEVVGQVKEQRAHAKDGVFFSGEEWGYVDDRGNIRQRDGVFFRGRIIGEMKGNNPKAALGYFVLRFQGIVDKVNALEQEMKGEESKARFLGRIQSMLKWVPEAEALGDFESLIRRLQGLEKTVLHQLEENLQHKRALCAKAETLSTSSDWKATGEAIKALQAEWKAIGPVPKADAEVVWERFRKAVDRFFERREAHFKERDQQQHENLHQKEHLCAKAEALSSSTDWKSAGEAMKALQDQWKAIGPVPKDKADAVWHRFRAAADRFYSRRQSHFEQLQKGQEENLRRKERLCEKAEALSSSTDWKSTGDALKALQAEWKSVGPVPRERGDALWTRFRSAQDRFYDRRSTYFEQRKAEGQSRMREALDNKREQVARLRESISHDEENVSRWRSTIYNLRSGGRADEIRSSLESKIYDVESKISSKRSRLHELEAAIMDIRAKLS